MSVAVDVKYVLSYFNLRVSPTQETRFEDGTSILYCMLDQLSYVNKPKYSYHSPMPLCEKVKKVQKDIEQLLGHKNSDNATNRSDTKNGRYEVVNFVSF